jgi:hypothetical protein
MRALTLAVAMSLALPLGAVQAGSITYNPYAEFSTSSNPNGVWAYGHTTQTLGFASNSAFTTSNIVPFGTAERWVYTPPGSDYSGLATPPSSIPQVLVGRIIPSGSGPGVPGAMDLRAGIAATTGTPGSPTPRPGSNGAVLAFTAATAFAGYSYSFAGAQTINAPNMTAGQSVNVFITTSIGGTTTAYGATLAQGGVTSTTFAALRQFTGGGFTGPALGTPTVILGAGDSIAFASMEFAT